MAFTDGLCLGNPGPCGAGACVFLPEQTDPILLKQSVSSRGSILLGELVAILHLLLITYVFYFVVYSGSIFNSQGQNLNKL